MPESNKLTVRGLAVHITDKLFRDAFDRRVDRLVLKYDRPGGERDMGGWCFTAAVDQVEAILKKARVVPVQISEVEGEDGDGR